MFLVCVIVLSVVSGLSANDCLFKVKLGQYLWNEGFHRFIRYKIEFYDELYENCVVGLVQWLPAGVFANPDELGNLKRLQKLNAIPRNRVNIELPAEESQRTSVFIINELTAGQAHTWLPVHARYHRARPEGGFANNEIEPPLLYLRCPDSRLEKCETLSSMTFLCNGTSKEQCDWKQIPVFMETNRLSLRVPVGNTSVYYLVAIVTAVVIVASSLYLLKTLHMYKIKIMCEEHAKSR